MRFKDSPEPMRLARFPPGFENKVMHASFRSAAPDSWRPTATKKGLDSKGSFQSAVPSELEAERRFTALAKGG